MSRNFASDQELIDRLLLNDTEAFEELYCRYWYSLFTYSLKKLQSTDDARQVVKNIFIELWEKRHSWPVNFSVSQHLYTEVRKAVVKCLKEKLVNESYNKLIEKQITEGFSVEALQPARTPVHGRHSELFIDRPVQDKKGQRDYLTNMKWLFQLVTTKFN